LTEKKFIILNSSELNFKYRWSDLKKRKNLVVYEILFDFSDDVKLDYKPPIEYLKRRLAHQPKGNTCGSFFKNVVDFDPDKIAKKLKNKEDIQLLENFIAK
jgi:UDP-N-acetylenolpyruvoylglucosamine reductase